MKTGSYLGAVIVGLLLAASQQTAAQGTGNDLGGVVTSANGPEAGVWVIAETTALPTKFTKIVVTDERGRYLIPELPKANYRVWVRGYGLVDSPKVRAAPGKVL
ncbi:MAG TPA: carboxypeptidase-like regulatory domain-containing protein, partial [Burkholderiales bacterium]|nr:carboxypeptidase-like regulatory domain-containing protein [Burkholderiales bacterium]